MCNTVINDVAFVAMCGWTITVLLALIDLTSFSNKLKNTKSGGLAIFAATTAAFVGTVGWVIVSILNIFIPLG